MNQIEANVRVLSDPEIQMVHQNALDILETVGMRVPNERVRKLAQELGARISPDSDSVFLPGRAVEELLALVHQKPSPARDDTGDALQPLTGNVSTQVFRVDYRTRTRRYGVMEDVLEGIALMEGLPNIPLANAAVVPSDVPHPVSDVLCFQNLYKYSAKPGGAYILTPQSAKYIGEMALVMDRPVAYLFDTISPLSFSESTLETALVFREMGLDLTMTPMVMAGSTGPVSLAGLITLQNAEALGSLFFIYAITGKIAKYVASGHTCDLRRNMFCSFGSPNQALIGIATAQMARHYGLKSGSNSGLTDSIFPDFQAGFEKTLSASFSCLAGTEAIGGQGLVGADQGISFGQLVLDNEWLDAFNYTARGIQVDEETIGLETIKEVGIQGNYLSELHTVEHMRDSYWPSTLFDRDNWDNLGDRNHDLLALAENRAAELVREHRRTEPVIEPQKAAELDRIAQRAVDHLAAR